jgi:hypothetical protein
MKIEKILVGLCLGLVLAGQSCEEENQTPQPQPPAAAQTAPQATTAVNDDPVLLRLAVEVRGHIVTLTRLLHEANDIADKVDAALDSGNCNEIILVVSSLNPRLERITNQMAKEDAWFGRSTNDPRHLELARSGMAPDLSPALHQVTAEKAAFQQRALDLEQRLGAAEATCGFAK